MQPEQSSINQPSFENENAFLQTMTAPKESQPTKNKVATFKTRVFRLLRIYAEKSKDLTPLLKSINQEIFIKEPQKVNQIITILLNHRDLSEESLQQLCTMYRNMLLFKEKKQNSHAVFAQTFMRICKKLDPSISVTILQEMLEIFATKRKCKLHLDFFLFVSRKMSTFRQPLLDKCQEMLEKNTVRPAQQRQLKKLQNKLDRRNKKITEQI